MSDVAQGGAPKKYNPFSRENRWLLYLTIAIAVAAIGFPLYYAGPGSQERAAQHAEAEYRLLVRDFSQKCLEVEAVAPGTQRYACRLLVRVRPSGNAVVEITRITRGAGNVMVSGRWSVDGSPVPLSRMTFFADRREYDRPGALAAPGDEAYKELSDTWLAQEESPEQ